MALMHLIFETKLSEDILVQLPKHILNLRGHGAIPGRQILTYRVRMLPELRISHHMMYPDNQPVKRHGISICHRRDISEESFRDHAAIDRLQRRRRLYDSALARAAPVTRTDDPLDPILDRHDIEHLFDRLADLVHFTTTARARFVIDVDDDIDTRQMERPPAPIAVGRRTRRPPGRGAFVIAISLPRRFPLVRRPAGTSMFGSRKQKLQLIGVDLFGPPAKEHALELREEEQELFVLLQRGLTLCEGAITLARVLSFLSRAPRPSPRAQ